MAAPEKTDTRRWGLGVLLIVIASGWFGWAAWFLSGMYDIAWTYMAHLGFGFLCSIPCSLALAGYGGFLIARDIVRYVDSDPIASVRLGYLGTFLALLGGAWLGVLQGFIRGEMGLIPSYDSSGPPGAGYLLFAFHSLPCALLLVVGGGFLIAQAIREHYRDPVHRIR